jgi:SAM-dependent methyltransferase
VPGSLETILCPTCHVDEATRLLPGAPEHIVRCRRCGLLYVRQRQARQAVSAFYEEKYVPDQGKLNRELGTWRVPTLRRETDLLKRLKPARANETLKILDVGCAGGTFLENFLNDGWECAGVEPARVAAEEARKRGITVYPGLLQEAQIERENYFDVVTYLDALCLSATPLEDLQVIHRVLKDDGWLAIDLPGYAHRLLRNIGPLCWLLNRRWSNISPSSPHLFIFSTRSLRRMLAKAGFELAAIHLEQAPTHGSTLLRWSNQLHFALSRLLYAVTFGQLNLAAKVFYVCRKRR